jgi:arylsulfatase A-like enzyme
MSEADLTRRTFLGAAGAAAHPAAQTTSGRWNLLFITNDQHRADCLGAAGNPVIRTPVMDAVARDGVLFESNFVQCPQCVPSRSAIHTGRYPHVNRTPLNQYRLPDNEETLATILNRHGYATAAVGDEPFAPTNAAGGFQRLYSHDPEYNRFLAKAGWAAKAAEHRERLKTGFQAHPAPWPEELDETAYFAGRAIDFLKETQHRPFFLHVNFRRPHHPFDPPAPFDRMYEGAAFPASHRREGEMKNKPPSHTKSLENTGGFDLRRMTPNDLDRIKSYYYGMISLNDKHIGRMLDALSNLGLAERTVVVITADHGEMLGDHGLLFKARYMYDEVLRTPLIIRAPGKLPAGRRVSGMTEGIDIMPALLELLGIPPSVRVQGRSLLPLVHGKASGREEIHSEFPGTKVVRTAAWKLVHYLRAPYGELYNLREDPHELHNLYDDPAYARARAEMKSRLADWLIESEDPALPPVPGQPA